MDFEPPDAFKPILMCVWLMRSAADDRLIWRYWRHPDGNRERLFFGLLRESMEGIVTDDMLPDAVTTCANAFALLKRTMSVAV
jgi:hypothetical protein